MSDCEVIRSSKVKQLDPNMRWNINFDFNGYKPFDKIELDDKVVAGVEVSQCKNYGDYEDAIVVVFELKNRIQ